MSKLRRGGGTETAGPLDPSLLARALRTPGIDPRHWLSYGTVCTINEDGTGNFDDAHAVCVEPTGCSVDVLLMPANQHVTARYSGAAGGPAGTIYGVIKPGDEVVVGIPDGDLRMPCVILAVMNAEHSPLPLNQDRTPVWKNDRILIHGATVPIEIRTGGGSIVVDQLGRVLVNNGSRGAARVQDTTKLTLSPADIVALAQKLLETSLFTPSGNPPTPPVNPQVLTGGEITSGSGTVRIG